jgi:hypothetical protein
LAAAVLSVPKAFVPVYVGWAAKPENEGTFFFYLIHLVPDLPEHLAFDRQHHGQHCLKVSFGCIGNHYTLHVCATFGVLTVSDLYPGQFVVD